MPIARLDMAKILYLFAEYSNMFSNTEEVEKEDAETDENIGLDDKGKEDTVFEIMIDVLNDMGYKKLKYKETTREEVDEIINNFSEEEEKEFNDSMDKAFGIKKPEKKGPIYNDLEILDESEIIIIESISKLELINGYEDGSFKPYKSMSRAEVATIIYRYNNK